MKPATYINEFLAPYEWKGSKRTHNNYSIALESLRQWCHNSGYHTVAATSSNIVDWLAYESNRETRTGQPQARSTLRMLYAVANLYYGWLVSKAIIPESPMDSVPRPKPEYRVKEPLTQEQIAALITATGKAPSSFARTRNLALLLTLVGTGARAVEVLGIDVNDAVDTDVLVLHGKGAKDRYVPLGSQTRKALDRYLWERGTKPGRLFRTIRNSDMAYPALYALLLRLETATGVKCEPHRFRHTYAAEHYKQHHDARALQMLLGHANLETTERYLGSLGVNWALSLGYRTPDEWLTPSQL